MKKIFSFISTILFILLLTNSNVFASTNLNTIISPAQGVTNPYNLSTDGALTFTGNCTIGLNSNGGATAGGIIIGDDNQQYTTDSQTTAVTISSVTINPNVIVNVNPGITDTYAFKVAGDANFNGTGTLQCIDTETDNLLNLIFFVNGTSTINGLTLSVNNSYNDDKGINCVQVGSYKGSQEGNVKLTLGNESNLTGCLAIIGDKNSDTTTVDINNAKITQASVPTGINSVAAISTFGSSDQNGTVTISINSGAQIYSPNEVAFYLNYYNATCTITEGAEITGGTGINLRGGTLDIQGGTITGTGKYENPLPSVGETQISGAGIEISGRPGDYKDAQLTISGGSIDSQQGLGIQQDLTGTPQDTNTLGSIQITGGNISGKEGSLDSDIQVGGTNASTPGAPAQIQKASGIVTCPDPDNPPSFSDSLAGTGYLGTGSGNAGIGAVLLENGKYIYFPSTEDAKEYAKDNKINNPAIVEIDPTKDSDYPGGNNNGEIIALSFNASAPTYYNTTQQSMQCNSTGLQISTINASGQSFNNITPEQLIFSASMINGGSNTISFSGPWAYCDNKGNTNITQQFPANGKPGYRITSSSNGWSLMYKFELVPVQGNNDQSQLKWSDLQLIYTGNPTPATPDGVYRLTAVANTNYWNSSITPTQPTSNFSFIVQSSDVTEVQILGPNNQPVNGIYSVDLNTTHTVDFGYLASNANGPTTGHVVQWSLTNPSNTSNNLSSMPYASVNSETGVVTFFRNLDNNNILVLQVTVDGKESNTVILQTTGELNYDETTGIAPVYNPLNVYTGSDYPVLNNNVVTSPIEGPISSGTLTFTSSNPNYMVYASSTSTTGPNTYSLIPMGSNSAGSTTITASWTNNGTTYETTFDVNFVSSQTNATGVTAKESLTFAMTDPASQNVDASLTPTNNTTQADSLDPDEGNGYTYESSNENVAVVDQFGNVSPVGPGTCTITTTFSDLPSGKNTATTQVTVDETAPTAETITLDPETIYLVPDGTEGTTSAEIAATVTPENVDPNSVVWSASSTDIAISETNGLTTTVSSTDAAGTYTITASVPGPDDTTLTATTTVIVADTPLVIDPMETKITADSPDFYTVTVAPVSNPALEGEDNSVQKVSIFTWSQVGQTDMDCKVVEKGADGTYSYTFPVNNTPINEFYNNASDIIVQAYASTNANSDGDMIMNTTWNYADCGWTDGVIATPYVQNEGFITPSVGDGAVAGTTGQALQMEGIRLSTPIEDVDIVYNVHVQNIGWMDQVEEGVYAGTMHENLQIEAIHIKLTGENASKYSVQYQAHVQDIGWQPWVENGQEAGTTGQNLQMEAIRVQIVEAGTALPTA